MATTFEACVYTKEDLNDYSCYVYHEGDFDTLEEAIKRMDEMEEEIRAEGKEYVVGTAIRESDGYFYDGDELANAREELGV